MTFRVMVADSMAPECVDVFKKCSAVDVEDASGIERRALIDGIGVFDGLVVRSRTMADADVIQAGKRLKVIGRAGIGVDNIDRNAATRAGIVVMNTPDGNATTTAEHTISLMFAAARHIGQATASMKAGKWEKKKFLGVELRGKTLGVLGLGNIGRIVANRAQGMLMKVVGFDPFFDAKAGAKIGIEVLPLEDVLRRADVLTVHTPLNDDTRGMIGASQLDIMKSGVILINCARGGIYDEAALLSGLNGGKIGSLALDVFVEEPPPAHSPLISHERVVCTPHLGASTSEAQVQVAVDIAEQICAFAQGEPARNAINMPRVAAQDLKQLGPFIDLAQRMGSFLGQIQDGAVNKIEVKVAGDIATLSTVPITSAVVAGALRQAFDRPVNMVNARFLAEERGIDIVEARASSTGLDYPSTLEVTMHGDTTHSVVGTVFAGPEGRFVVVDGIRLEAQPEGCLLVVANPNEPGVIGHIGQVLGDAGINIARMHLGLDHESGQALSLISVTKPVPDDVIKCLGEGDILSVRQVVL